MDYEKLSQSYQTTNQNGNNLLLDCFQNSRSGVNTDCQLEMAGSLVDCHADNIRTKKRNTLGKIAFLFLISTIFALLPTRIRAEEQLIRSSTLHEIVTYKDNVEKRDFVDDKGNITYASNKHYATIIKTKGKDSVLEEFFDEMGNPAEQTLGHYALMREYNELGQDYKITYLDINGEPAINKYGYAIVVREYDEKGKVEKEYYLDNNEKPAKTSFLANACRKEYDDNGRMIASYYLDIEGNYLITSWGCAIVRYEYYESGTFAGMIKREYYFDDNLLPISLGNGQFGLYHEYDEFGRDALLTYLDADGSPIVTNEGYTTIKRTYYADDSVRTEFYYDKNGNPICLSEGQYGVLYTGEKKVYLNAEGKEVFVLRNYLYNNQTGVICFCILAVVISLVTNKRMNYIFIFLYCIFILYMTIMHRNNGSAKYNFIPFKSYMQICSNPETIWGIINNVLLFVPIGAALYRIYPRITILLVPLALSFVIESLQFILGIGHCELDDIIHNGLGGLVGFQIAKLITRMLTRIRIRKASNII